MMLSRLFLVSTLAMAVVAVPAPLPPCSAVHQPCQCPVGTTYSNSTTYAVIGASATDVKAVTGSFFDTAWFGAIPFHTTGVDNEVGATRSFVGGTAVGTYTFVEAIVSYTEKNDGSYHVEYQQVDDPVPYEAAYAPGSFSGYWDTLDVKSTGRRETSIVWNIYACFTGTPASFSDFHESALNNATAILKAEGKLTGSNVAPYST